MSGLYEYMYTYSVVKHDRVETISHYPRKTTLNGGLLIYFAGCFVFYSFSFWFYFYFCHQSALQHGSLPACVLRAMANEPGDE